MPNSIFSQYPPPKWTTSQDDLTFGTLISIRERLVHQVARHPRLWRRGQRLDWTSRESRVWTMVIEFYNFGDEEGIGNNEEQYPDRLNRLLLALDTDETGSLVVPTIGPVRAKCVDYERVEQQGEQDFALLTITFVEDSEDDESALEFQAPAAGSVVVNFSTAMTGVGEDMFGVSPDIFTSIGEFAAEIEGLVQAPGQQLDLLEQKIDGAKSDIESIEQNFAKVGEFTKDEVEAHLTDPSSCYFWTQQRKLHDTVAKSVLNLFPAPIVTKTYPVVISLAAIASSLDQSLTKLIAINQTLPDIGAIPPNTPVRVFMPVVPI